MNNYQKYLTYNNYLQKLAYTNMFKDHSTKEPAKEPVKEPVKEIKKDIQPSQKIDTQKHHYQTEKPKLQLELSKPKTNEQFNLKDYDMIKQKNNELFVTLSNIKTKEGVLQYMNSLKDIHKFTSEHTNSDKVTLIEGFIVKKICINNSLGNYMFTNEINALSKLRGYPHFPHLIAYDPKNLIIYMTYCGGLLTSENLPNNWRDQIHDIKEIMTTLNINSNDMLMRNTCCLNGEIKIIDFGLHTIFGRTIEEVIGDLYNNMNILSSSKNKVDHSIKYKYMEEYPNWKLNLEKYKHKQVLIKKALDNIKTSIKKEINTKRK
jgi:tRNA A-37 threonylcarbamoyl transferase component Bud32